MIALEPSQAELVLGLINENMSNGNSFFLSECHLADAKSFEGARKNIKAVEKMRFDYNSQPSFT